MCRVGVGTQGFCVGATRIWTTKKGRILPARVEHDLDFDATGLPQNGEDLGGLLPGAIGRPRPLTRRCERNGRGGN